MLTRVHICLSVSVCLCVYVCAYICVYVQELLSKSLFIGWFYGKSILLKIFNAEVSLFFQAIIQVK